MSGGVGSGASGRREEPRVRLASAWRRLVRPRHTVRPTREGWWCLVAAMGLGLAAVNTGHNLIYLLCALLLGLVTVSGLLSEVTLRGLRLEPVPPEEAYARRPVLVGARIQNRKRWLASHSLAVEVLGPAGSVEHVFYLPRLSPGEERWLVWEAVFARRGRQRLGGVRLATRFPFGLFVKVGRRVLEAEVLVFPAVGPVPPVRWRELEGVEGRPLRRRGRGHDLYDLRPYRTGDDPRLIHWRTSARAGTLLVRELEDDTSRDTRIVLTGTGAGVPGRLEAALEEAASLAVHLLGSGAAVEVVGPGFHVGPGRGRGHARRILERLALYDPDGRAPDPAVPAPARGVREVRVSLD